MTFMTRLEDFFDGHVNTARFLAPFQKSLDRFTTFSAFVFDPLGIGIFWFWGCMLGHDPNLNTGLIMRECFLRCLTPQD